MLQDTNAFSSFAVDDLPAARNFYKNQLGIEVKEHPMGLLELCINGSKPIIIYAREQHTPAVFTILNFPVADVEVVVDSLSEKGIVFEQYPEMGTDSKGISRKGKSPAIAWFKDPAGNILSIIELEKS